MKAIFGSRFFLDQFQHGNWKWKALPIQSEKINNILILLFLQDLSNEIDQLRYEHYKDQDLLRRLLRLAALGYASLPEEDYVTLMSSVSAMDSNYARARVCDYYNQTKCTYNLEPDLSDVYTRSRDPKELAFYWTQWYDKAGTSVAKLYREYIRLNTKAAQINGFPSGAEMWLGEYEDDTFEDQLEEIMKKIEPFYAQLHAYVRNKLRKYYGDAVVSKKGPIPMHLLGNIWAQSWVDIEDLLLPYPEKQEMDISKEMSRLNYTTRMLFEKGDEFFQSLNMTKLPESFWKKSILERPADDRNLICHPSAWDFYRKDDVRIKQCSRMNMEHFMTAHHELGHIQYYLQYQDQPSMFRTGANPGFHEAVGDVIALSVNTPKHLVKIGLMDKLEEDEEAKINHLMRISLEKIPFLSFAYTIDKYRWSQFRNETDANDNCKFWELRDKYSGVEPPVERSNKDFDAPAKYHVSADVEYVRYLVAFVIQFQFHKRACELAGQYRPNDPKKMLSDCDIYGSAKAGEAFKAMLSMGASKPWPFAMEAMTGQRRMDAGPLLEYFEPLQKWLIKENKRENVYVGWERSKSKLGRCYWKYGRWLIASFFRMCPR